MILPDFSYETSLWKKGFSVIGIDEVGRGAFAGPVGVGGVVFDPNMSLKHKKHLLSLGINDSKKLTPKKRKELSLEIKKLAKVHCVTFISVETINDIGVGRATLLGMKRVVESISHKLQTINSYLLIDAFEIPGFSNQKGIIRGDSLSISIASASIIAKVERDQLMEKLGLEVPAYRFEKHKGYGTYDHRQAIGTYGMSKHHRTVFCKNYSLI